MANGNGIDLPNPDQDLADPGVQYNWPRAQTLPPVGQQPAPAQTPLVQVTPTTTTAPVGKVPTIADYTPAELTNARARGMIGQNGLPTFLPGTVKFNSQGVPYNPAEVGANAPQTGPGSAGGKWDWGPDAAQHYEPYWPNQGNQLTKPGPATATTTTPPPNNALAPTGNLVSNLNLQPQQVTGPVQYMPNQPTPAGHVPTTTTQGPTTDPDAGQMVPGTNIPISTAKQFIRAYEPGPMGYRAAYGMKGGLPENVEVDQYGFPTQQAYPGAPVGDLYGGAYKGQMSHAAGMYQFEPATWRGAVQGLAKEGVTINDFSPQSQEKVATYLIQHGGMNAWLPYNDNLRSAWNQYQQTGTMPNLSSPADYQGFNTSGGALYSGDVVPGSNMAIGGKLAIVPPRPAFTGPNAPGGPAVNPEANTGGAGGPGGSPSFELTPAEKAFQQSLKNQGQGGRGFQMLGLLAAAMRGHQIAPISYDPMANTAHLQTQQMPIGGNYEIPRVSRQLSGYVGF